MIGLRLGVQLSGRVSAMCCHGKVGVLIASIFYPNIAVCALEGKGVMSE
jgi:hypothetical protein